MEEAAPPSAGSSLIADVGDAALAACVQNCPALEKLLRDENKITDVGAMRTCCAVSASPQLGALRFLEGSLGSADGCRIMLGAADGCLSFEEAVVLPMDALVSRRKTLERIFGGSR